MAQPVLIHFLLGYDRREQALVIQREFEDSEQAVEAYGELEREHWEDSDMEIVLLGADSIETLKVTHGNYFGEAPSGMPELLGAEAACPTPR